MQGKLPQQGEIIKHSVFTFTIEALNSHSIKKIKVEIQRDLVQES
jgi:Mg2+/Co2+ transporter CorC